MGRLEMPDEAQTDRGISDLCRQTRQRQRRDVDNREVGDTQWRNV